MGLFFGQNKSSGSIPVVSNIKYGRLYNGITVRDQPLFAPLGWHIPTQSEFQTLLDFVCVGGNRHLAGGLKETGFDHWNSPNTEATNITGFTGLPGGILDDTSYLYLHEYMFLWSNTQPFNGNQYFLELGYNSYGYYFGSNNIKLGYSVRMLKDDSVLVPSVVDIDGNVYTTVKIGDQVWLVQNWACTKLSDGTEIPEVTDPTEWWALTGMARTNPNNDINNVFL